MIREIEGYLEGKLKQCQIRTETKGDITITECRTFRSEKKGAGSVVALLRMTLCGNHCRAELECNINRVILNFVLAAILIVTVLPALVLAATAIYRLNYISKMRKRLEEIMRKYAN